MALQSRGFSLNTLPQAAVMNYQPRPLDFSPLVSGAQAFQAGRERAAQQRLQNLAAEYALAETPEQRQSILDTAEEGGFLNSLARSRITPEQVQLLGDELQQQRTLSTLQEELQGLRVGQARTEADNTRAAQLSSLLGEGGAVPMNIADEDVRLLPLAGELQEETEIKRESDKLRLQALRQSTEAGALQLAQAEIKAQAAEIAPMLSFSGGELVIPDELSDTDPVVMNNAIEEVYRRRIGMAKTEDDLAELSKRKDIRQIQNALGAINAGQAEIEDFAGEPYFDRLNRAENNRFTTERTPEGILVTVDNVTGERIHSVTAPTIRDGKATRFSMPDWWKKRAKNMPVELYPSEREAMTEFLLSLEGDEEMQDEALALVDAKRRTGFFTGRALDIGEQDKTDAALQFYQKLVDARNAEDVAAAAPSQSGVPTFATEAEALSAARAGRIKKGQVIIIGGKRMELE